MAAADWVLVVRIAEYQHRFERNAPAEIGWGVRWESQHITQQPCEHRFQLYEECGERCRYLTDPLSIPASEPGTPCRLPPLVIPVPQVRAGVPPHVIGSPCPDSAAGT